MNNHGAKKDFGTADKPLGAGRLASANVGYAQPRQAHRDRLARTLADPALGLTASEYDFVYSSSDFLRALGKALDMTQACDEAFLAERDAFESTKHEAYKPW
ncbi:hypothetical protein R5M92_04015 [Halomonas sp. Bachu 37]|uniref:hypothetical protein n=1 Tax=Halomonas kashgarensis TaxID=3084920 RepID=UPI00321664B7